MRRITGAAALGYVVLAAIENMTLLGLPGLGASETAVRAAYADTAVGVVTVSAGALSLLCYVVFAAGLGRLAPALAAVALAGGGVVAAALLVGGGDPALLDVALTLRYLAGPPMALVVVRRAPLLAAALALTPLALAGFELLAQLAFAASAAWIWWTGMRLTVGASLRDGAFLMLVIAAGLVGVALLVVPGATGAFFAWSLAPAPLAAFAGGVYVGSAVLYAAGLRAADAQSLVVAAVVLSLSVLAATFAHLDVFDFGRLQAWAWVALFAAFGAVMSWLAARGTYARAPGPRLGRPARALFAAAAVVLAAAALALWLDPAAFSLPPLGGRFAGSWAAMLATLAAWPAIRGVRDEARLPALALVVLPLGAAAGLVEQLVEEALALLVLLVGAVVGVHALRRLRVEPVPLLLAPAPADLAEEALVVVVPPGDDLAFALEDAVELSAVEPDASAVAAGVDPHATSLELDELAAT